MDIFWQKQIEKNVKISNLRVSEFFLYVTTAFSRTTSTGSPYESRFSIVRLDDFAKIIIEYNLLTLESKDRANDTFHSLIICKNSFSN